MTLRVPEIDRKEEAINPPFTTALDPNQVRQPDSGTPHIEDGRVTTATNPTILPPNPNPGKKPGWGWGV